MSEDIHTSTLYSISHFILVPNQIYRVLYKKLNPDYDWDDHFLITDCSNVHAFEDWVFTIGDRDFHLSANDFIIDVSFYGLTLYLTRK